MKYGVRGLAFVVAVLAHIALVALLTVSAKRPGSAPIEAPRMVLVFIEPEARRSPGEPLRSSAPSPGLAAPSVPIEIEVPPTGIAIPPVEPGSAITATPDTAPEETPAPPPIDWQQETRTAAARMAESLEAERRRTGKRTPDARFARPAPRPEFGWDQSKIHRIEALPEGGTIIHLNDRCILALTGLIFPLCKIGKIPARGDLFEHMGDAPSGDDGP